MIGEGLEGLGYLRFDGFVGGAGATRHEWLHVVVRDRELDLLLNFNLSRTDAAPRGQVLLLARDHRRGEWEGDLDAHPLSRGDVGTGRLRLRIGGNTLDFDGGLRVQARCRRRPLEVALTLVPEVAPYLVPAVPLSEGTSVHWMVCPRMRASGVVRWRGRAITLRDAVAYHDHNWGCFHRADLQWEWGCTLAAGDRDAAPSVVVVRVLDPSRRQVTQQGMIVWEGAQRRQLFRGTELDMGSAGWLRGARGPRVPRALSLLAPDRALGVPARVSIEAASAGDELSGGFTAEDVARVLVPNDRDLGTTVIHEIFGRLRLAGRCAGRPLTVDAPAVFERLGGAP